MATIEVDGHRIEIERAGKVLFPQDGITKGDLIDYYRHVAGLALPLLADHPLTLQRFPDGIDQDGFYQKDTPDYFPGWIQRVRVPKKEGGSVDQVVCDSPATLIYLANQACVTLHPALSPVAHLNNPDRMVIDLDPPSDDPDGYELARRGALLVREALDQLGLVSFVMTTGSRGLHVVVPLDGAAGFDRVRTFAEQLAKYVASRQPNDLTTEQRKSRRGDRLFLDVMRNAYGQTSAAPYSVRARRGAPVAMPLDWSELDKGRFDPRRFHTTDKLEQRGREDPWQSFTETAQSLDNAEEHLPSD